MSNTDSDTPVQRVYAAVAAMLTLRRPDDALVYVRQLSAQAPDSFDVYYLSGLCHIAAGRVATAEEQWRQATALNPDHALTAVLGVRCAVAAGPKTCLQAWARAQRVRALAPDSAPDRFWVAFTAARCGRVGEAYAELAVISRLDPAGNWPLYTAAEVDLALSARRGLWRRRATVAENAVRELLGRDPQDSWAHELRARTAPLQWNLRLHRRVAEAQLGYTREAARAGVLPPPGQLERQTLEAARPAALAFFWALVAFSGGALLDPFGLAAAIAVVSLVGALLVVTTWYRLDRVLRTLPVLSRRRFVRPVTRVTYTAAAVLAGIGLGGLLILYPFTQAHAVTMQLGKDRRGIVEAPPPVPEIPTFPTFSPLPTPRPGRVSPTYLPIVPVPTPGGGPSSTSVPAAGLVDGRPVDPEKAWTLMRYWTFVAAGSIVVAACLALRAVTLRRALTQR